MEMRELQQKLGALSLEPEEGDLLIELFDEHFGLEGRDLFVAASAPGRVELAGNHVDHQGGRVITAGINLRTFGLAAPNGTRTVRLYMNGFGFAELDLSDENWMAVRREEYETSIGILRGMAAAYARDGKEIEGFDLVTSSDVPSGCGLSSSAAFEMLLGSIFEAFGIDEDAYEGPIPEDPVSLALAGMEVEQRYFGKSCGAQDQLASAIGGAVAIDFATAEPAIMPVSFDADTTGYVLCLIDSHFDHSTYSDEYSQVPKDMTRLAESMGGRRLCEVPEDEFFANFGALREEFGDGVVMRALHYYDEVRRVDVQRAALTRGDFETFLTQMRLSGASSAQYLQNVSPHGDTAVQPCMVILGLCAHFLGSRGAWRIHGGGFGGSVLALVPDDMIGEFCAFIDGELGYDACIMVTIDNHGAWAVRLS